MNSKEELRLLLETLPEDVSLEGILYHLYVKAKILRGLKDIEEGRTFSHEEVKEKMEEWFLPVNKRDPEIVDHTDNVEIILMKCCRLRGNPLELIHRTLHEFNWFYQNLIFDREQIISNEVMTIEDKELAQHIKDFSYSDDIEKRLLEVARLFHSFCKNIYGGEIFTELGSWQGNK